MYSLIYMTCLLLLFTGAAWVLIRLAGKMRLAFWWTKYRRHMHEIGAWHDRMEQMKWNIVTTSGSFPAVEVAEIDSHMTLEAYLTKYGVKNDVPTAYGG